MNPHRTSARAPRRIRTRLTYAGRVTFGDAIAGLLLILLGGALMTIEQRTLSTPYYSAGLWLFGFGAGSLIGTLVGGLVSRPLAERVEVDE